MLPRNRKNWHDISARLSAVRKQARSELILLEQTCIAIDGPSPAPTSKGLLAIQSNDLLHYVRYRTDVATVSRFHGRQLGISNQFKDETAAGNDMLRTAIGWVFLTVVFVAALPLFIPLAIYGHGRRLASKLRSSR